MTSRPSPSADPRRPVLVGGRRTAIGTAGHGFARVDVIGLAAPVLAAVADQCAPLDRPVDDVIIGNCLGPGGNIARVAALAAGLGEGVPGVTVDRQCGSGLDAVLQAAARVRAGDADLVLAGGAESASTAPWRFWPPAAGGDPVRYTRAPFAPSGYPDPDMGQAADHLARLLGHVPGTSGRVRRPLPPAHRRHPGQRRIRSGNRCCAELCRWTNGRAAE